MAAETENTLQKVDSLTDHQDGAAKKGHRRVSSMAADVYRIEDLGECSCDNGPDEGSCVRGRRADRSTEKEGKKIEIAIETQKLNWKLNKSPSTVEDPSVLKMPLTEPKLKSIALHFPLGLEVTARNMKGVTIKDALDAIHKQFKKRADDEFEKPYLMGFEWDPEECYTRFIVHQSAVPTVKNDFGSSKKKKKNKAEGEEGS
ncbi:hypothetical protein CUC08_Gglean002627 [Alternaria sp. MG1]|jgi:hypothetical protein|nr:hypothetical protein CUC08_Gglean002627 [Alternaria sp. MG1]